MRTVTVVAYVVLATIVLLPPSPALAGQAEGTDSSFASLGADDAFPHPSSNLGDGVHEKYHGMIHSLAHAYAP
ncbi:MAG: hypothetical protein ACREDF_06545 [Thermoplasmata archaeon]